METLISSLCLLLLYHEIELVAIVPVKCVSGCSTYHIALFGTPDYWIEKSATLLYEPDNQVGPRFTSSLNTCDSIMNINNSVNADSTILPHAECGDLFLNETGISANGIKVDNVNNLYVNIWFNNVKQDGFLAIPDRYLGNEYYILTYCTLGGICQFCVVATENQTRVTMTFPPNINISSTCSGNFQTPAHAPDGNTISILLNESEVFYYDNPLDLSGVYVYSDKRVSVFAGTRNFPSDSGEITSLVEQIPPINKWGTHFIAAPFYLNTAGDVFKIISQSKHTKIHIQGFSPFVIEEPGQSIEKRIDHGMYVEIMTSQPTLIAQMISIDLFNQTLSYFGKPSMTLIPHTEQFQKQNGDFRCDVNDWFAVLSIKYVSTNTLSMNLNGLGTVEHEENLINDQYGVAVLNLTSTHVKLTLPQLDSAGYMYCGDTMATHLGFDWAWNNTGCVITAPYPGDGIDNNCDGNVDEMVCTPADLMTIVNVDAVNVTSGAISYYQMNIRGAGYFDFSIRACSDVILNLKSLQRLKSSVSIMIQNQTLSIVCGTECTERVLTLTSVTCTGQVTYGLYWYQTGDHMIHHLIKYNSYERLWFRSLNANIDDYDKLFVTTLGEQVNIKLGLTEKDCAPIDKRGTTMLGRKFTIPVYSAPEYDVIITSPNAIAQVDVIGTGQTHQVEAQSSLVLKETDFFSKNISVINIISHNADVFVFFTTNLDGVFKGLHIYPSESSSYTYQLKSSATTGPVCFVHATDMAADTNIGRFMSTIKTDIYKVQYDSLGSHHTLESNRPLAVFCKTIEGSLVQMNPTETFGTQFFIPPVDLVTIGAIGEVSVVASEDSTVIEYKTDFDIMEILERAGDEYTQPYEFLNDLVIEVRSRKPVQVILKLWRGISVGMYDWNSVIYIPSVDHYTDVHYFPAFAFAGNNTLRYVFSSAVDDTGNLVTNQVITPSVAAQTMTYTSPTFSITSLMTSYQQILVFPSNHLLESINHDCSLKQDVPGDGVDGDCDGLVDEEECSLYNVNGSSLIDLDLDGTLNVDCRAGTQAPVLYSQNIEIIDSPCLNTSQQQDNSTDVTDDVINIEVYITPPTNTTEIVIPPVMDQPVPPIYPELISEAQEIALPVNDLTTNLTTESCVADCSCPCGWVNPAVNYTTKEIRALVAGLQHHLKVYKPSLSVVKRQKTSAEDNRTSAVAIGYIALFAMLCMLCSLILLDISQLFRDIKRLIDNLKNIFKRQ